MIERRIEYSCTVQSNIDLDNRPIAAVLTLSDEQIAVLVVFVELLERKCALRLFVTFIKSFHQSVANFYAFLRFSSFCEILAMPSV